MRCGDFENRIHDLLDRRCVLESDDELLGHAIQCERCQAMLEGYTDLWIGLDAFEPPALEDGFSRDVVALATGSRSPRRRSPNWLVFAGIAIAASLLVALVWQYAGDNSPSEAPRIAESLESELNTQPPDTEPIRDQLQPWPETGPLASIASGQVPLNWEALLSEERLAPVSDIAGGIEPITSNLSAAIHAIRSTIPLGRVQSTPAGSENSARVTPLDIRTLPT